MSAEAEYAAAQDCALHVTDAVAVMLWPSFVPGREVRALVSRGSMPLAKS